MRNSAWRVVWDALGSPSVLLEFDELMDEEMAVQVAQLAASSRADFAAAARPSARRNVKRRLELRRRIPHATPAESWEACLSALAADPWGLKSVLSVTRLGGEAVLYRAALLSASHEPGSGLNRPESIHHRSLRVTPLTLAATGDGVTIIGGWYNPPGEGITVTIPGGSGIEPGGVVKVDGVPGIPNGYYPVTGVTTGGAPGGGTQEHITLGVPHDEPALGDGIDASFSTSWEQSPQGIEQIHRARIRGVVAVTSAVEIEVYRRDAGTGVLGWFSYAPGSHDFDTVSFADDPREALGAWTGLTPSSGAREVTYARATCAFRWRRIGGSEQVMQVPAHGTGEATYISGSAGTQIFTMPAVPLAITATGASGGAAGTIDGGGTITPVESP